MGDGTDEDLALAGLSEWDQNLVDPSVPTGTVLLSNTMDGDLKVAVCQVQVVFADIATVAAEIAAGARTRIEWFLFPTTVDIGNVDSGAIAKPLISPDWRLGALQTGLTLYDWSALQGQTFGGGLTTNNAFNGIVPAGWRFGFKLTYCSVAYVARVFPAATSIRWSIRALKYPKGYLQPC